VFRADLRIGRACIVRDPATEAGEPPLAGLKDAGELLVQSTLLERASDGSNLGRLCTRPQIPFGDTSAAYSTSTFSMPHLQPCDGGETVAAGVGRASFTWQPENENGEYNTSAVPCLR
jgi:hypothetical protein